MENDIKQLEKRIDKITNELSGLTSGLIVLSKDDLKETLSGVWDEKSREGEKLTFLHKIWMTLVISSCISISIGAIILFLILFTEPI